MVIQTAGGLGRAHGGGVVVALQVVAFIANRVQQIAFHGLRNRPAEVRAETPVNHGGFSLGIAVDGQSFHHHEPASEPQLFAQRFGVIFK